MILCEIKWMWRYHGVSYIYIQNQRNSIGIGLLDMDTDLNSMMLPLRCLKHVNVLHYVLLICVHKLERPLKLSLHQPGFHPNVAHILTKISRKLAKEN